MFFDDMMSRVERWHTRVALDGSKRWRDEVLEQGASSSHGAIVLLFHVAEVVM